MRLFIVTASSRLTNDNFSCDHVSISILRSGSNFEDVGAVRYGVVSDKAICTYCNIEQDLIMLILCLYNMDFQHTVFLLLSTEIAHNSELSSLSVHSKVCNNLSRPNPRATVYQGQFKWLL